MILEQFLVKKFVQLLTIQFIFLKKIYIISVLNQLESWIDYLNEIPSPRHYNLLLIWNRSQL